MKILFSSVFTKDIFPGKIWQELPKNREQEIAQKENQESGTEFHQKKFIELAEKVNPLIEGLENANTELEKAIHKTHKIDEKNALEIIEIQENLEEALKKYEGLIPQGNALAEALNFYHKRTKNFLETTGNLKTKDVALSEQKKLNLPIKLNEHTPKKETLKKRAEELIRICEKALKTAPME